MYLRLLFFSLSCCLFVSHFSFAQPAGQPKIPFDSLRIELNQAQNKKQQIDAMLKLGSAFYVNNMTDSLQHYALQIDTSSLYGQAGKHFLEGHAHYRKMNLNEAIASFEKATTTLKTENKKAFLQVMNILGICYLRTKQYPEAKTTYLQMLEDIDEANSHFTPKVHGNLGMVYRNLGDFNKAIEHLEKCVALEPNSSFSVANSYLNIASMFQQLELYEKAITTLGKVDTLSIAQSPIYVAYNNNLAENYEKLGNNNQAKYHFSIARKKGLELRQFQLLLKPTIFLSQQALANNDTVKAYGLIKEGFRFSKKRPFPPGEIALSLWASSYFLETQHPDSALVYSNKAIALAEKTNSQHALKNVFELKSLAFDQKGMSAESNKWLKRHNTFTDSINNKGKLKLLADARAKYSVEETKEALGKSEKERTFFASLSFKIGIVAMLLTGVAGFLYVAFFRQKQSNVLNKEEIEQLNKQLAEQTSKARATVPQRLLLKSKAVIDLDQLQYIKSDGPYLEFHLDKKAKPEIDRNTLKSVLEELPQEQFVQVHRSYVVNIKFVRSIFSTRLMLTSGEDINISRSFKANIENILIKPE